MSQRSTTSHALRVSFILIVSFALPAWARASVIVSEVMYDPPGTNTKQSWLELYNDGPSAVDVSKWSVTDGARGSSGALTKHAFNVPPKNGSIGSATIPAGGYLIIADDAATFAAANPSVANVIDSVFSISNPGAGAEVGLLDAQGSIVDTFSFSADPYASNKGNSLQRSGGQLVSALPTPAAPNATEAYVPPEAQDESDSSSSPSKAPSVSYVPPPAPVVFADAGADRTVVVGADTPFRAQAYDRDRDAFKSAKFVWNFGDGTSAEGSQVMHHFSYPGRYDVELYITNQNYSASSRVIVSAKEAVVGMAVLAGGGVSIQNRSGRDLDLSYWLVRQGATTFRLPEHSVVLKDEAINIDQATLGFAATDAKLLYPNEAEVVQSPMPAATTATTAPAQAPSVSSEGADEPEPVASSPAVYTAPAATAAPDEPITMPAPQPEASSTTVQVPQEPASAELAASAIGSGASFPMWTALAGLGGIVGLGIASVYAVRRRPVTGVQEEEFTIE
jgi:hypothetical protein